MNNANKWENTTLGATPVSQEQKSETTIHQNWTIVAWSYNKSETSMF